VALRFGKTQQNPDLTTALQQRTASASALSGYALDTFTTIITDLEESAAEHLDVAMTAQSEADRLDVIAAGARAEANKVNKAAGKIRELVGDVA